MTPPAPAHRILKWILPPEDREYLMGDFEEVFLEKAEERGRFRAAMWYWGLVCVNLPGFLRHFFYWRITMVKNYIKVCFRNLMTHKGYSLINIAGLGLGLACCILMMLWAGEEFSFDRFHQNRDRLYRVYTATTYSDGRTGTSAASFFPLAELVTDSCPGVQAATRVAAAAGWKISAGDRHFFNDRYLFADPAFMKMFTVDFLVGDPDGALTPRQSVVLTQSAAHRYFGENNPLGKILRVKDSFDVMVTGVVADMPAQSTFRFDMIFPYHLYWGPDWRGGDNWGGNPLETYVLLSPGTDVGNLENTITGAVMKKVPIPENMTVNFRLQPLTRVHLYDLNGGGLIRTLSLFGVVALFILVIACINFMNLATARASVRAGEVGLRKVAGARRGDLIYQFLGESLTLTVISLVVSLIFAALLLPFMNGVLDKRINLQMLTQLSFLAGLGAVVLVTGVLAGSYPALFLSSFQPLRVMKGIFSPRKGGSLFRKALVVFQFSLAVFLIVGASVMAGQLKFMDDRDMGFDKDHVMGISLNDTLKQQYLPFKTALLKHPDIIGVTRSLQHPAHIGSSARAHWEGQAPGEQINVNWDVVDLDYFKTFDMKMVQGRPFSKDFPSDGDQAFVVNREAVKRMGLTDPLGKRLKIMKWEGTIVGVVKDFHFQPLKYQIKPFVFKLMPGWNSTLFLRFAPGTYPDVTHYVRGQFETFNPGFPFNPHLVKDAIARNYGGERKISEAVNYFTFLAVVISCLGLLGLSSFMIERRIKEIGLRKVMGATTPALTRLLATDFLKWVALANIFAWPLAYAVMTYVLREYAYRVPIRPATFLFSAVLVLAVAFLTVCFQIVRASGRNPVQILKNE